MEPNLSAGMFDLFDGKHLQELEIHQPGLLVAGRLTDLETGESWRFVYRSVILKTTHTAHKRAAEWLEGAVQFGPAQISDDPDMMYGRAELTFWEP